MNFSAKSTYELFGGEKIDSSWQNIEFSNYFFGKFARVFLALSFFLEVSKKACLQLLRRLN